MISLRSTGCDDRFRLICRGVRLQVTTPAIAGQVLLLEQVVFNPVLPGSRSTFHRGSLAAGFVDHVHTIMLADLNDDGHEDLMVWTGFEGTYGVPSYTYYLHDHDSGRLIENRALVELIRTHSVSRIRDGKFEVWCRSGPCGRGHKTIDARGDVPAIVERTDIDTCRDDPGR